MAGGAPHISDHAATRYQILRPQTPKISLRRHRHK